MSNLESQLADNRAAVRDLEALADRSATAWNAPRAPGKWTPAEVVEHVARAMEEGANVIAGRPSKLPTLPSFLRPVVRGLVFNRVVKTGRFLKARTNRALTPATTPAAPPTPAEGKARLESALAAFEKECRARVSTGKPVESPVFGVVSVEDYARFNEMHTRHHTMQIPSA